MPHGQHIATCMHCGKQWTVGDCIPDTCEECYAEGHRGIFDCPVCAQRAKLRREKIDAAIARNAEES